MPGAWPRSTISPADSGREVRRHQRRATITRPERRALQDVVTAIRLGCTVEELGLPPLQASAERHLKEPAEMAPPVPSSSACHLLNTQEIVQRCSFSLRQLTYQYPVVYEGGETPMDKLHAA